MAEVKKVYKFKEFDKDSIAVFPPKINLYSVKIGFNNNNVFFMDADNVWALRLSSKKFQKLFSIKELLEGKTKISYRFICSLLVHGNKIYIIMTGDGKFNRTTSILVSYDLEEVKIRLHILSGDIPMDCFADWSDGAIECNLFYHEANLYTVMKIESEEYLIKFYRLSLTSYTWEHLNTFFVDNFSLITFKTCQYEEKIFVIDTQQVKKIGIIDINKNSWSTAEIADDDGGEKDYSSLSNVIEYVDEKEDGTKSLMMISCSNGYFIGCKINLNTLQLKCLSGIKSLNDPDAVPKNVVATLMKMVTLRVILNYWTILTPNGRLIVFDRFDFDSDWLPKDLVIRFGWVKIPTLEDICWEAVVHYFPDLTTRTKKQIVEIYGISPKIVQAHTI